MFAESAIVLATLASALRPTGVCRPVAPPQPQPVHTLPWAMFREAYGYEQAGQFVPVTTFAEFVHHFGRGLLLDSRVVNVPMGVQPVFCPSLRLEGFCRKVRFLGQNPKIGYQKFNDLQTAKLSKKQLCDRTGRVPDHCG